MTSALASVVVTGGNSGLGYACARTLLAASPRWHVVVVDVAVTVRPILKPGCGKWRDGILILRLKDS